MKINKWYEKAISIFDSEAEKGIIASNLDDGLLFANSIGTYALYIPGYVAASAFCEHDTRKSKTLRVLHDQAMKNSELVKRQRTGTFADRKYKVRELFNGHTEVYVYEKWLRMFPKNALFYTTEPNAPVVVCIWENDRFYEIGIVMPMFSNEFFKADV